MRGTQWEQGYNRPTGCSAEKTPHATFNFNFNYPIYVVSNRRSIIFIQNPTRLLNSKVKKRKEVIKEKIKGKSENGMSEIFL